MDLVKDSVTGLLKAVPGPWATWEMPKLKPLDVMMAESAYRCAHDETFSSLPVWKQQAITDDRVSGNWDSAVLVEFARAVIKRAEQSFLEHTKEIWEALQEEMDSKYDVDDCWQDED